MKIIRYLSLTVFISLLFSRFLFAQVIKVHVRVHSSFDKSIPFTPVVLIKNGIEINLKNTDTNGYVEFEPIDTGTYDIKVFASEYKDFVYKGISVKSALIYLVEIPMVSKKDTEKHELIYKYP